jgi:hypothetical protein
MGGRGSIEDAGLLQVVAMEKETSIFCISTMLAFHPVCGTMFAKNAEMLFDTGCILAQL